MLSLDELKMIPAFRTGLADAGLALDGSTAYESTIGLLAGSLLSAASGAATLTLVARRRSRAALRPSGSMEDTDREAPR